MKLKKIKTVEIAINHINLPGSLFLPLKAKQLVIFAHGSGSSRFSPRNLLVAEYLYGQGIASLLFDLLTEEEDLIYENRFDIELIAKRLVEATKWLLKQSETKNFKFGYFGASTGAAAALEAAVKLSDKIEAVVSRGGRPDLAMPYLSKVKAPTLLIVGGWDEAVIELNKEAYSALTGIKKMVVIPEATHLFEEEGKLEEVAKEAAIWFKKYCV